MVSDNTVVERLRSFFAPSVWVEFQALASKMGSVNLGAGLPGWPPPQFVTDALTRAAQNSTVAQYASPTGNASLRQTIARIYGSRLSCALDHHNDVLITVGASQALLLGCQALLEAGDEVVLIEPAFDIYPSYVQMTGAVPVYVPLRFRDVQGIPNSSDLYLDMDELAGALSPRTRMLILNTPHNPTGKVFSREELTAIANLLDFKCPRCVVLSDEVYEKFVFKGTHVPFATVSPSAMQRTVSIYSSGKTFSVTGWRLGWLITTNPKLMRQLRTVQQFVVFSVNSVCQAALIDVLKAADKPYQGFSSYYDWLRYCYLQKRDFTTKALIECGLQPVIPDGTFYMVARVSRKGQLGHLCSAGFPHMVEQLVERGHIEIDPITRDSKDHNLCRNLTILNGVTPIPCSPFFTPQHRIGNALAEDCVRFAFCKTDDELEEARRRLLKPRGI